MLSFKPLTLEDKIIFDKFTKPYTFATCEFSFTSLFIWRKGCDIQYTIYKDTLLIKKMDFDGSSHFMQPIGYTKDTLKELVAVLIEYKKEVPMEYLFKDAETPFIEDLKEIYGEDLIVEEDRDNYDYIYESQKLISLAGKKLHTQKNHYNNFIRNTNYRIAPLCKDVIADCIQTSKEWCCKNDCKGYLLYELRAIEELLKYSDQLDFIGIVVYVDEKISAFTIGEKLNDSMALIHIEKADTDVKGLYTFINKIFVETYFSDIPYINREQDLGIENLRKTKLSYRPFKLEPKYSIKDLHLPL